VADHAALDRYSAVNTSNVFTSHGEAWFDLQTVSAPLDGKVFELSIHQQSGTCHSEPGQQLRFLARELLIGEHAFLVQFGEALKGGNDFLRGCRRDRWRWSTVGRRNLGIWL
jgi:hypothetical protein